MKEKKLFIIFFVLILAGFLYWYLYVDLRQSQELNQINTDLKRIIKKVEKAKLAKNNISKLKDKYEQEQKKLLLEKERFVNRNDLSLVTKELKNFAVKNKLTLLDFAPAFTSYFSDSTKEKVSTLPIEIKVQGKYFDIGHFIEGWEHLPFYLIARDLEIARTEQGSNLLNAKIIAVLYTWNEFK